ncbi:hypothetical protein ABFT23_12655 [Nocardioides sp. C4-1]|uniref:hypothetical protein n=1 Tax=Nocardioides sp. C4-1 TaxID=3151851 RepID=UPI003266B80B
MSNRQPPPRVTPSRGVYRRRRLMVGATVVLLAVAVVDMVNGDGPDRPVADTVQGVGATSTETSATDAPSRNGGKNKGRNQERQRDRTPTPTPTPEPPPPLPDPVGTCDNADVSVTPTMQPAIAGRAVLITLTMRTIETPACTWTIDRDHLAYKITDGDTDVWSSSHCPAQVPDDTIVLRSATPAVYRLAWTGRTSTRDCPPGADHAKPGEYGVQAAAIGGEPSPVVEFALTDPPPPPAPAAQTGEGQGTQGKKKRGDQQAQQPTQQPG